ncbi:MAG TPA: beta-ketoacyl-ACP synthase III [Kofleriaceae bacterium]|nr:beta-ketoacyl-ACP synthase III [Kofleriaceae bacterium]
MAARARTTTGTAITGAGVWHPEHILTNEELCVAFNEFVRRANAAGAEPPLKESSPEFIEKASGIKRRYIVDKTGVLDPERMCPNVPDRPEDQLCVQAEFAVNAVNRALAAAGRAGEDVDFVVCGTSMLQRSYPAIAIEVQHAIGAHGLGFDLTLGCSSGVAAIQVAVTAIQAGQASCAVVVSPELMSGHNNWRERDGHFLFGDAAVALVIEKARPGAWEILSIRAMSKFSSNIRNNFGFMNRFDPATQFAVDKLFHQQGRRVYKDVIPMASKFIADHVQSHGIAASEVARYWLHQANQNMNELISERILGRPATRVEAPVIIDTYGNTASAGAAIAFTENNADLPAGSYGLLSAFGAGYSIGSIMMQRA